MASRIWKAFIDRAERETDTWRSVRPVLCREGLRPRGTQLGMRTRRVERHGHARNPLVTQTSHLVSRASRQEKSLPPKGWSDAILGVSRSPGTPLAKHCRVGEDQIANNSGG